MCKLFINGEPELWKSTSRSLRIDGFVTSIRLENFFWDTLEEISDREHVTVNQMIGRLFREAQGAGLDTSNFTSFLRVCCSRYLSLIADKHLERDATISLDLVDSKKILQCESEKYSQRKRKIQSA